eukprot:gnl/MRDRNA2_/MRDRNA2_30568_c0_seq2.p1 gnl/MRDRNA2_/MRDRNA2_30568_c0~~gnl/MRDRNA2_/MRDRNA2_30568_c0_seq2.p1  ORF type:complete len:819 (-),score=164.98 gnl/MRDRNA2_/MRDRNA2_30568_c0_seq2:81-2174(-)
MAIKVVAWGKDYFKGGWNVFDFCLTWLSILDVWVFSLLGGGPGMKAFAVLRILRIFRVMRLLRMVKSLRELTLIVTEFVEAMKTTFWVSILLLLVLYIFAIFCASTVGKPGTYAGHNEEEIEEAETFNSYQYFGTIPRAMFTLFNLVLLSDDWFVVSRAVMEKQPGVFFCLLLFVMITSVGLMSVIGGIIVEHVIQEANLLNSDDEAAQRKELLARLQHLYTFVFELDLDKNGSLDAYEINLAWDRQEMKDLLAVVNLPIGSEAQDLIDLIDQDGDGELEMSEFVKNLIRLLTNNMFQHILELKSGLNRLLREVKQSNAEARVYRTATLPQDPIPKDAHEQATDPGLVQLATPATSQFNFNDNSQKSVEHDLLGPSEMETRVLQQLRLVQEAQQVQSKQLQQLLEEKIHQAPPQCLKMQDLPRKARQSERFRASDEICEELQEFRHGDSTGTIKDMDRLEVKVGQIKVRLDEFIDRFDSIHSGGPKTFLQGQNPYAESDALIRLVERHHPGTSSSGPSALKSKQEMLQANLLEGKAATKKQHFCARCSSGMFQEEIYCRMCFQMAASCCCEHPMLRCRVCSMTEPLQELMPGSLDFTVPTPIKCHASQFPEDQNGNDPHIGRSAGENVEMKYWGLHEIKVWLQVTMNTAHAAAFPSKEAFHTHLRQRWDDAQRHIAPSLRGQLRKMIEEELQINFVP